MQSKDDLRRVAQGERRRLSSERRQAAAERAAEQLLAMPELRAARRVLVYAPLPDELDPLRCFSASCDRGTSRSTCPTKVLPDASAVFSLSGNDSVGHVDLDVPATCEDAHQCVGRDALGAPPFQSANDDSSPLQPQLVWPRVADRAHALLTLHACTESELVSGSFGIREPREDAPQVTLSAIDVALVPGLAFDQAGYRIGHGKGYYDRLLADAPAALLTIGLCFKETFYPEIAHDAHDIAVARVIIA